MYERILVPVDDSPSARAAARHARTVADWTGVGTKPTSPSTIDGRRRQGAA